MRRAARIGAGFAAIADGQRHAMHGRLAVGMAGQHDVDEGPAHHRVLELAGIQHRGAGQRAAKARHVVHQPERDGLDARVGGHRVDIAQRMGALDQHL